MNCSPLLGLYCFAFVCLLAAAPRAYGQSDSAHLYQDFHSRSSSNIYGPGGSAGGGARGLEYPVDQHAHQISGGAALNQQEQFNELRSVDPFGPQSAAPAAQQFAQQQDHPRLRTNYPRDSVHFRPDSRPSLFGGEPDDYQGFRPLHQQQHQHHHQRPREPYPPLTSSSLGFPMDNGLGNGYGGADNVQSPPPHLRQPPPIMFPQRNLEGQDPQQQPQPEGVLFPPEPNARLPGSRATANNNFDRPSTLGDGLAPGLQVTSSGPKEPAVQRIIVNIRNIRDRLGAVGERGPQRRLFLPSMNRVMLSLIAPRMLRFQFDMMLQAIVAEVVRKVVFPLIGVVAGSRGGSQGPGTESNTGGNNEIEEEDAEPVKAVVTQQQQQQAPAQVVMSAGDLGALRSQQPTSFVIQSGVQGAPFVTAVQSPSGTSPGQLQFVVTSHPSSSAAPNSAAPQQQQFLVQLQPQQVQQLLQQQMLSATAVATAAPNQVPITGGQPQTLSAQTMQMMIQSALSSAQVSSPGTTASVASMASPAGSPQQIHIQLAMPAQKQDQERESPPSGFSGDGRRKKHKKWTNGKLPPSSEESLSERDHDEREGDDEEDAYGKGNNKDSSAGSQKMQFVDTDVPNYGNSEHTRGGGQSGGSGSGEEEDAENDMASSDEVEQSTTAESSSTQKRRETKPNDKASTPYSYPVTGEEGERERAQRWNTVLENYGNYLEQSNNQGLDNGNGSDGPSGTGSRAVTRSKRQTERATSQLD